MKNDSTGKKVFCISCRPIFSFLFGETSENIISHMLWNARQVLNSIFADHVWALPCPQLYALGIRFIYIYIYILMRMWFFIFLWVNICVYKGFRTGSTKDWNIPFVYMGRQEYWNHPLILSLMNFKPCIGVMVFSEREK